MANRLARSVSIIGTGYTPLGDVRSTPEILNFTERELFAMACMEAMEEGNIKAQDIDACYVACSGPNFSHFKSAAPLFANWIGMDNKPVLFHDEGCGSSAFGLEQAVLAVASGAYDCVISGAVNINTCVPDPGKPPHERREFDNDALWASMASALDAAYIAPTYGGVGQVEAILVRYQIENNLTTDQINDMFINYLIGKRREAMLNPKATKAVIPFEQEAKMMGFDNVKDYLLSKRFNPPMGTLIRARFLGSVVDGASAIIVCATDQAYKYVDQPIEVAGVSSVGYRDNALCELPDEVDTFLFNSAYEMAGITDPANEVDYLAVHDCPASMVLPLAEISGYIPKGEAWKYMMNGEMTFDGAKPINTTGGRTQSGHPRSPAFGVEVDEAVRQMRGVNGPRQMKNRPKVSVVWGGGSGFNSGVCVLRSLEGR